MRILVVEDDVKMAALLRRGLVEEGLTADVARSGDDAVWMTAATDYDAIVLDVMLPGADGFAVCRRLRESGRWSPVLMLTARDAVEDRVAGLDAGADDYLVKPFSFAELLARRRALVRRPVVERPAVLEVADLRLDTATHRVWRGDEEVRLSPKEFALLETFMRRPGEVLSTTTCSSTSRRRLRPRRPARRRSRRGRGGRPRRPRGELRPGARRPGTRRRRDVPGAHRGRPDAGGRRARRRRRRARARA